MIPIDEIRHSSTGAWQLFLGEANGMHAFNTSFEGFLRSFGVVVLVFPLFLIFCSAELMILEDLEEPDTPVPSPGFYFGARTIVLIVDWLAFPVLMIFIARLLDLGSRYVSYIVAYNWTALIAILPLSLPLIFFGYNLIPALVALVLSVIGLGIVMRYRWFVAVTALGVGGWTAFGLVVIDLALSFTLTELTSRAMGI